MSDKFEANENSREMMPLLSRQIEDYGLAQANEFIVTGQSAGQAASIVANLFIQAAWIIAASGAVADERTPDPDKFRARVEEVITSIQFKVPPVDDEEGRRDG